MERQLAEKFVAGLSEEMLQRFAAGAEPDEMLQPERQKLVFAGPGFFDPSPANFEILSLQDQDELNELTSSSSTQNKLQQIKRFLDLGVPLLPSVHSRQNPKPTPTELSKQCLRIASTPTELLLSKEWRQQLALESDEEDSRTDSGGEEQSGGTLVSEEDSSSQSSGSSESDGGQALVSSAEEGSSEGDLLSSAEGALSAEGSSGENQGRTKGRRRSAAEGPASAEGSLSSEGSSSGFSPSPAPRSRKVNPLRKDRSVGPPSRGTRGELKPRGRVSASNKRRSASRLTAGRSAARRAAAGTATSSSSDAEFFSKKALSQKSFLPKRPSSSPQKARADDIKSGPRPSHGESTASDDQKGGPESSSSSSEEDEGDSSAYVADEEDHSETSESESPSESSAAAESSAADRPGTRARGKKLPRRGLFLDKNSHLARTLLENRRAAHTQKAPPPPPLRLGKKKFVTLVFDEGWQQYVPLSAVVPKNRLLEEGARRKTSSENFPEGCVQLLRLAWKVTPLVGLFQKGRREEVVLVEPMRLLMDEKEVAALLEVERRMSRSPRGGSKLGGKEKGGKGSVFLILSERVMICKTV